MKLRNKKTGEIGYLHCDMNVSPAKLGVFEDPDVRGHYLEYRTLAELNEDWEDYKPAEPLIKDEKIRKAVRAWAEANEFEADYTAKYYLNGFSLYSWQGDIEFNTPIKGLKDGEEYTIAELCGEEEE